MIAVFKLVTLLLSFSLTWGKELRSTNPQALAIGEVANDHHNIQVNSVVGSFPTNPQYGVYSYYSDASCSQGVVTNSYLLDSCMSNGTISVKYSCSGSDVLTTEYSDPNCATISDTYTTPSTCTPYSGGWASSFRVVSCGTSSAFSSLGNDYSASVQYADSSCGNSIMRVLGYVNGHCFDFDSGFGYVFDWPNQKLYTNTNCATLGATIVLDQTCSLSEDDDYQDPTEYQAYTKWVGTSDASHKMSVRVGMHVTLLAALFISLWK